jgi:ring-1,2-phenylacetyl-CoA epoxidase subunit PaaD
MLQESDVWKILKQVMDPEIPAVSIVELGIVREVAVQGDCARVSLAPTFSACPALEVIQRQVEADLLQAGIQPLVNWSASPPWSSDWITPDGRLKLASIGLVPPPRHSGLIELALIERVTCPFCGSIDTTQKNSFGPTLCRSIFYCNSCRQPFERFKPV